MSSDHVTPVLPTTEPNAASPPAETVSNLRDAVSNAPRNPMTNPRRNLATRLRDANALRNATIGLSDGLTVPFALTAGLASLGDRRLVLVGGLAELVAGALSMGCGALLAAQTEMKRYDAEETKLRLVMTWRMMKAIEKIDGVKASSARVSGRQSLLGEARAADVERSVLAVPEKWKFTAEEEDARYGLNARRQAWEVDRELVALFGEYGIDEDDVEKMAWRLAENEDFKLHFEQRLKEDEGKDGWLEALVMGTAYFIGGLLPMIPYFFMKNIYKALVVSVTITTVMLVVFGYLKAAVVGCRSRDRTISSIQTLVIGLVVAGLAYGVVKWTDKLVPKHRD